MPKFVMSGLAALVAVSAPMPAFADCPSSQDMERGVAFVRSEPRMESHFVRDQSGTVVERRITHRDDGSIAETEAAHLLGLVAVTRTEEGRPSLVTRLAGSDIPEAVPSPGTLTLDGVIDIDGEPTLNIALEYDIPGETGTVAVGSCDYETSLIRHVATTTEIDGDETGNPMFFEYQYSRELGVILETIRYQDDGFTDPIAIVTYDTTMAER